MFPHVLVASVRLFENSILPHFLVDKGFGNPDSIGRPHKQQKLGWSRPEEQAR
jgi:hypothetical protein